jgi:hypothetical protein
MSSAVSDLIARSSQAQPVVVKAAARAMEAGQDEEHAVLLARTIEFLSRTIASLSRRDALQAAVAGSDMEVLLATLDKVPATRGSVDVGAELRVRLRGLAVRERMLEAEGGVIPATTVAKLLGISPQAVQKRRQRGQLLAIPVGRRRYLYPQWQFTDSGTLTGLEATLETLRDHDAWTKLAFFLAPNSKLNGCTALHALRQGDSAAVIAAAETYGEHGAD